MIHPATTGTPSRIGYPSPRVHCANDSGRHITANGAPSSVTTRLTSMPDCSPRAIARAYPSARTSNVNCCPELHAALSPSQAITSLRPLYERPTLYNSSNPSSTDTPNANVPPLMSARLSATSGRASRIRSRDGDWPSLPVTTEQIVSTSRSAMPRTNVFTASRTDIFDAKYPHASFERATHPEHPEATATITATNPTVRLNVPPNI